MRQLSGMDSEFLAMESGSVVGHFGTVTLLAPPAEHDACRNLRRRRRPTR